MEMKPQPNRELYIQILRRMTPQERLKKALELSSLAKRLMREGLRQSFPHLSEEELHKLYLERLARCYNKNW